jgi:hypothetical protein
MEDWKKITQAILLLGIVAVGVRVYFIYQERHAPAVIKHTADDSGGYQPTADDYTYLKQLHPESPKDIATLLGKTVWTQVADQLPYFPVQGTHVDYAHQVGVLRGATPLAVTGMIQQVAPRSVVTRVPNGDKQVLIAFNLPNDTKTYAAPVGYHDMSGWTFIADQAFFYDDPHTLYSWSPKTWQAIDGHTAIVGMTEQQAGLALGQVESTDSQSMGDRTVHYDNLGHPVDVTFVKNHAKTVTHAER